MVAYPRSEDLHCHGQRMHHYSWPKGIPLFAVLSETRLKGSNELSRTLLGMEAHLDDSEAVIGRCNW